MRLREWCALGLCLGVIPLLPGCGTNSSSALQGDSSTALTLKEVAIKEQVTAFCGDCHGVPHPETFPKRAWRHEVEMGFDLYARSGRNDLVVPPLDPVVRYYEDLAPQELLVRPPTSSSEDATRRFVQSPVPMPGHDSPAISFINWQALPGLPGESLIVSDMRSGMVAAATGAPGSTSLLPLAVLLHPSRATLCDLDQIEGSEFVVGELGSFQSADHSHGAIHWLRPGENQGSWRQEVLASGLGRVADVRTADFDGDGDEDLVVAEFGHLRTGKISVYENLGMDAGRPKLREHVIDPRHGGIHVPIADLNGDGRLDFVALISQEYEVVEAYLNSGDFKFTRQTIYAAGDPSWGSSGIELVDLDRDKDLDVLYSNGDTFGSDCLKPYHGIIWLENKGRFPFTEHPVAEMVGVQSALTGDVDSDGDLDVVAVAFMPHELVAAPALKKHDSVIWVEQVRGGQFVRHSLERGNFRHAALEINDFDSDGDLDLAVGNFQSVEADAQPWLTIWWNALPSSEAASESQAGRTRD